MRTTLIRTALACAAAGVLAAPAGAAVAPFGTLDCVPRDGVRFCEGSIAKRVPTFDGVPLDVNLTLPASGDRNLPLVVSLHGWGGSKSGFGADAKAWAQRGYAFLSYSARGFGDSCGSSESRDAAPDACKRGWVRLADARYEARDTQHLAGLLVDEGLVHPGRIGVAGGSYGGGQSLILASLRDRIMVGEGEYAPWVSPRKGIPLRIAAAAPVVPWSDLVYALQPNGRTLDYALTGPTDDLSPVGIMKSTYVAGLFAAGRLTGHYALPGQDPDADLTTWFLGVLAGEPYAANPLTPSVVGEIASHHSAYYLDLSREPAPTLLANGWTDDLFPVDESVRWVNRVRARYPGAKVAQLHFDFGHARGQNKAADTARLREATFRWFDRYVRGLAVPTPFGVETWTQTCPREAPSEGPFRAKTWAELHPGEVRLLDATPRNVVWLSGSPFVGQAIDPISGGGACATTGSDDQAGAATYRFPAATGAGYVLMGAPTIVADMQPAGLETGLAGRLWDVAPDGRQTLVARGVYRPRGNGRQVFQLHPNGWRFRAGHVAKIELLGQDLPAHRLQNVPWVLRIRAVDIRLPVAERPGAAPGVGTPAPAELPPGAVPARG